MTETKIAKIKALYQIDKNHWTVSFLDGEWKGEVGDYKTIGTELNSAQIVKVTIQPNQNPKLKDKKPSRDRYCGTLIIE